MANIVSNQGTATPPAPPQDALAGGEYTKIWGVHPNYVARLIVRDSDPKGLNFVFEGSLDETFGFSLAANWSSPFAELFNSALGGQSGAGAVVKQAIAAAGITVNNKLSTAQVWDSSSPISFSIPFTFIANENPAKEVKERVLQLLKCVAPGEGGEIGSMSTILKSPGPTIIGTGTDLGGRLITLELGKFLVLKNCIIKGVNVQFDTIMGLEGIPHRAKVQVDIESYYGVFTSRDLDELFKV